MFESHFLTPKFIGVISYCQFYHLLVPFIGTVQLPSSTRLLDGVLEIYGSSCPEGERTKHLANTKQRGKSEKIDMRRRWPDILGIIGKLQEIRGNPALPRRKKVPSIFEFQTAKPLPFSKSPKWRKNYSSPFFFQKKYEKNKPEKKI